MQGRGFHNRQVGTWIGPYPGGSVRAPGAFALAEPGKPAQIPGPRLRFININANNTVKIALTQNGSPVVWKALARDGADLPPEQALSGPASFLIAPGETYDFQFRPEREGEMEFTLDLTLLKERVAQVIRVHAEKSP